MSPVPAIVFDLDGTLIDSAPDIHAAAERLLAEQGRPALPVQVIRSFIGHGIPALVAQVIAETGLDVAQTPRLTERFTELYLAEPAARTVIYAGVPEALARLRGGGFRLGLCTNKAEALTRAILTALDLDLFDVVIGGDTLAVRKPDPSVLTETFARLGSSGLYVGDSEVDAETAAGAGLPFALFAGGYRKKPVSEIPHDWCFDSFAELDGIAASAAGQRVA